MGNNNTTGTPGSSPKEGSSFAQSRVGQACISVKNKVKSLLGRFKKSVPEKTSGNKPSGGVEHYVPLKEESKVGKIVSRTSLVVVGILSGLAISQMSPHTDELTSKALHAFGVKHTTFDTQQSLIAKNSTLEASLAKPKPIEVAKPKIAEVAKPKVKPITKTAKSSSKELTSKNPQLLAQVKEKKMAEEKQKVIDSRLKKLLELRGMKGILKHEGVPVGVTDYSQYIKKQNTSLAIIEKKIAAASAGPAWERAISEQKLATNTKSRVPVVIGGEKDKKVATKPMSKSPVLTDGREKDKKIVEEKQKMIDSKLKKLFVLQGMSGVLKHEGIPAGVTDYDQYIKKQDRSLANIEKKIAAATAVGEKSTPEKKLATKPKFKVASVPIRELASASPTWKRSSSVIIPQATLPLIGITEEELIKIENTPQKKPDDTLSEDKLDKIRGSVTPPPPDMEVIVSNKDTFKLVLTEERKTLNPSADEKTSTPSPKDLPPVNNNSGKNEVIIGREFKEKSEAPLSSLPITEGPELTRAQKVMPDKLTPDELDQFMVLLNKNPNSDTPKEGVKESEVSEGPVIINNLTLAPDNITSEKLESFLSEANGHLSVFNFISGDSPLKGVSLTMKSVTVKGVPAWRVYLKRGDKVTYFTLKKLEPGQKSRNYKIISSEVEMIKWTEKKVTKWGAS